MNEQHGRSPVQIAEDQILLMMEVNQQRAYSRADAVTMRIPIDHLNRSFKEWETIINNLVESQDNTATWLTNVNHAYNAFVGEVRKG